MISTYSRFLSTRTASGSLGFKAHWTEIVSPSMNGDSCDNAFRCKRSSYCLQNNLLCNNVENCGPWDKSDEEDELCMVKPVKFNWIQNGLIFALICLSLIIIVICRSCICKRGTARSDMQPFGSYQKK